MSCRCLAAWTLLFLLPAAPVSSIETFQLELQAIDHPGWQTGPVRLEYAFPGDGPVTLRADISDLRLADDLIIPSLRLTCENPLLSPDHIRCTNGSFSLLHETLGELHGRLDLSYSPDPEELSLHARELRVADGVMDLRLLLTNGQWTLGASASDLDLAGLQNLMSAYAALPEAWSDLAGSLDMQVDIRGGFPQLDEIKAEIQLRELNFNGPSVAENGAAKFNLEAVSRDGVWSGEARLQLSDGQFYLEPGLSVGGINPGFAFTIGDQPVDIDSTFSWNENKGQLDITGGSLNHPGVVNAEVVMKVDTALDKPLQLLDLTISDARLDALYAIYLQPLLLDSVLNELEILGGLKAKLRMEEGLVTDLELQITDLYLDDQAGRFQLSRFNGDIHFGHEAERRVSSVEWDGAGIYRLDIGAARLQLQSRGKDMSLVESTGIPLLDGELRIDSLQLEEIGESGFSIRTDGVLTPISLADFTQAMDWPVMAGKLSGIIPGLSYSKGVLAIDGTLLVRAFNGNIVVNRLNVADLFGLIPTLTADIRARDLDLETLTSTFSFGRITGKLEGDIKSLRLENWSPVYFEAAFATPEDDKSRHRISQQAVEDVTSLGGGGAVTNAVSRQVMSVFKEFSYRRLGIKCRLHNGICEMDGVAPAQGGYYLVMRGVLPPWIDVKGYNRTVDWDVMVDRLQGIMQGEEIVIE